MVELPDRVEQLNEGEPVVLVEFPDRQVVVVGRNANHLQAPLTVSFCQNGQHVGVALTMGTPTSARHYQNGHPAVVLARTSRPYASVSVSSKGSV